MERIEAELSGREMALAEIRADLAHPTMEASSRRRMERMFAETPLCDRICEAIEKSYKGKDRSGLWRRIRAQQRDALFLMHLWTECNTRVISDEGETREMVRHLASLNALILENGQRKGARREHVQKWIEIAHGLATRVLYRLYYTALSIDWLRRNYFNGEEVLFRDVRAAHRGLLAVALRTIRFTNRMIEFTGEEFVEPPEYELPFRCFDIRAASNGAKRTLRPVVKQLIDTATAGAHAALDENREAAAVYRRLNGIA